MAVGCVAGNNVGLEKVNCSAPDKWPSSSHISSEAANQAPYGLLQKGSFDVVGFLLTCLRDLGQCNRVLAYEYNAAFPKAFT